MHTAFSLIYFLSTLILIFQVYGASIEYNFVEDWDHEYELEGAPTEVNLTDDYLEDDDLSESKLETFLKTLADSMIGIGNWIYSLFWIINSKELEK